MRSDSIGITLSEERISMSLFEALTSSHSASAAIGQRAWDVKDMVNLKGELLESGYVDDNERNMWLR